MTSLRLLIVLAAATTACGGKKSVALGKITSDHVACKPTEMHGRFDCATPLRDYFHANSDAHIAGVNVIYGEDRDELLVWRTHNDAWPKASSLDVDNHECSPASGSDPGCATVIDDLTQAKPPKHHYFIVPVFGAPDKPAPPGTWSVLDIRSASSGSSDDAGWNFVKTELLRCRLGPGEPDLADLGEGVMNAQPVGSNLPDVHGEYPGLCRPVLINYLRAHADDRIVGVVPLDTKRAKPFVQDDSLGDPGTITLLVLVGSAPWPQARTLSVTYIACLDAMCAPQFANTVPQLKASPRLLFTVPIGDTLQEQTRTDTLLTITVVD